MVGEEIKDSIGGEYVIDNEIGRGGFGIVYLAHNNNKLLFAIKMIGPIKDDETIESFKREIISATVAEHTNVLKFIGQGSHSYNGKNYFFTVTEYCPDGNYRKVISNINNNTIPNIISEFKQILSGLDILHQHIVHRDIKPENILVSGNILKVADLGLSKSIDEVTKTLTFKGSGTPHYMAPEVWERKKITPATDLYAVGVMMFEHITKKLPFTADDFTELRSKHLYEQPPRVKTFNKDIPNHIDGLIRKLLEKDPNKRYQTAKEVMAVLDTEYTPATTDSLNILTSRIRQNYDTEQKEQLEQEKKISEEVDSQKRIKYMEQQVISLFDEVVDDINKNLQETKIERFNNASGIYYLLGAHTLNISFFTKNALYISNSSLNDVLKKKFVIHGGMITIHNNREAREGWNIVLIQPQESSYGEWLLIESDISALVGKSLRYPPASTDATLLSENLAYHWLPAMHSWYLKDKTLERTDVERILGIFIP